MKKIFGFCFLALMLTGCQKCKKNTKTIVNGYILDAVTGQAVPNAEVYLGIIESSTWGVGASTADKTVSNAHGGYSFNFDAVKGKDYAIIAKANGYFETQSVSAYQIEEGKSNDDFHIKLDPKAVIKINVKKLDMSYDSLVFYCNLGDGTGTLQAAFGRQVDTSLFYSYLPAGTNKNVYAFIDKFNAQTLMSSTSNTLNVYLKPVDTTYINLNY